DAPEPDALGDGVAGRRFGLTVLEQLVHRKAVRVGAGVDDARVLLLEIAAGAGQRAAGADRADKAVDLAAGLLPDFRAGGFVMRLGVVEVVPLVGEQHAVRLGLAKLLGETPADMLVVVGVGVGKLGYLYKLGSAKPQHVF